MRAGLAPPVMADVLTEAATTAPTVAETAPGIDSNLARTSRCTVQGESDRFKVRATGTSAVTKFLS